MCYMTSFFDLIFLLTSSRISINKNYLLSLLLWINILVHCSCDQSVLHIFWTSLIHNKQEEVYIKHILLHSLFCPWKDTVIQFLRFRLLFSRCQKKISTCTLSCVTWTISCTLVRAHCSPFVFHNTRCWICSLTLKYYENWMSFKFFLLVSTWHPHTFVMFVWRGLDPNRSCRCSQPTWYMWTDFEQTSKHLER